jgi:hypothetical protein
MAARRMLSGWGHGGLISRRCFLFPALQKNSATDDVPGTGRKPGKSAVPIVPVSV